LRNQIFLATYRGKEGERALQYFSSLLALKKRGVFFISGKEESASSTTPIRLLTQIPRPNILLFLLQRGKERKEKRFEISAFDLELEEGKKGSSVIHGGGGGRGGTNGPRSFMFDQIKGHANSTCWHRRERELGS